MRVAFLTPWSVHDPSAWSGVVAKMYGALVSRCDVDVVETRAAGDAWADRLAARITGTFSSRSYLVGHALATSRRHARFVERELGRLGADVVLAVAASQDIAHLKPSAPIVQITDATFAAIRGFYSQFDNLHPVSARQGLVMSRRAQSRTATFGVASEWASRSLVRDYGVAPEACRVVPFGPAIEPEAPVVREGGIGPLRVLTVASDWERKGGADAVEAVDRLRRAGADASLTVVGQAPRSLPAWVRSLGRVDRKAMPDVYAAHEILLELATANAGGVTMTDAHAFGLPVIATATGGTASIVSDGVTGLLVQPGKGVAMRAAEALAVLREPAVRAAYSARASKRYAQVLNWDVWAEDVLHLCRAAAGGTAR